MCNEMDKIEAAIHNKKLDILDAMILYECGELSAVNTCWLFQELINSGEVWLLQGCYGRMAQALIDAGLCEVPQ
jgi:hypothetical protein